MKILVDCTACFIGDTLFASSLAKKLKEKYPGCSVDYLLKLRQPKCLLEKNPYIDEVYVLDAGFFPVLQYAQIIRVPVVDQRYPATIQFQAFAGIEDQSLEFDVYIDSKFDDIADDQIAASVALVENGGVVGAKPLVAFQSNWEEKSFLFTEEEYERAIDVPYKGYGGKIRDITTILQRLLDDNSIHLISVGLRPGVSQFDEFANNEHSYAFAASVIKKCDWFIGSEGGLSNLACAVGTKCIITTDYIHQLYGPKGVIKQIDEPAMGPATYYPDAGHVHLSPFLTDEQVAEEILHTISHNPQ